MVDYVNTQIAYSTPDVAKDKETADSNAEFKFFGDDGATFLDFVDMVNPLQHIPFVATAYRALTGDEIDPAARLVGGTIFGGPVGLAASTFNVLLEHNTGMDTGEHVLALFEGEEEESPSDTQMANNNPTAPSSVASFAPIANEEAAFAAGDASLRMADLYQFMNQEAATQVSVESAKGTGSAGTWAPAHGAAHPFPTERVNDPAFTIRDTVQPELVAAQAQPVAVSKRDFGYKAIQNHDQSVDTALQAFARDMQAQQKQQVEPAPQRPPVTTSTLNQTSNNGWFADMMSQNMELHRQPVQRNPQG